MDKLCQNCQAPLAADAPRGLCPACLLKVAMATGTEAGREKPGFTPPSIEELARKFPQLEILELIGRGGMGAVYKARQKELDRIVALKILPPGIGDDAAFADRFAREAKAMARLNHPGIVTIHDFGRADGLYFFVMEFVDGVNLRQLLASGRVSPREALAIVPQICDALQFAHDQGIVHRDIKPENILLDRRGRVKVADFGLAKLVESNVPLTPSLSPSDGERVAGRPGEGKAPILTEAGKVMGTPAYMAPEQVEHPADVDHRADIYALGVVFYQMLTGELPGKRIEPPSKKVQIDVRLDEVVLRALEKNPELRYQQVSEVKTCVETIISSGSAVAPAAPVDAPATGMVGKAFDEASNAAREARVLPEPSGAARYLKPGAQELLHGIKDTLTKEGLVLFAKRRLHFVADQALLLFDFTASVPAFVEREGRRRFNFWPFLLLFISTLGFLINGVIPALFLVMRLLHMMPSPHGNPFVLSVQEYRELLWMVLSGAGRLVALNLGSNEVAGAGRAQAARDITKRRVSIVFRKLRSMAAMVAGGVLIGTVMGKLMVAASTAVQNSVAGVGWWVLVCGAVGVFVAVGLIFIPIHIRVSREVKKALAARADSSSASIFEAWLAIIDGGNYAQSWEMAAASFRRSISKEEWVGRLEKVRRPLGKVLSRKLSSTKPAAFGRHLEAKFATSFDGLSAATETVTLAVQPHGEWKAIGYLIKPAGAGAGQSELHPQQASAPKTQVETIAATPGAAPPAATVSWMHRGLDYRSKATILGLPWLHVTSGMDPATGRQRVAKGIIAIGGIAKGVVAIGGVAMGGLACGGLAVGVFAYGGLALGLLALGGGAVALVAALGGGAIAPIALGGGAMGYFAYGGGALGVHVLDAMTKDPAAARFFLPWGQTLFHDFQLINALLLGPILAIGIGVPLWLQRGTANRRADGGDQRQPPGANAGSEGGGGASEGPITLKGVTQQEAEELRRIIKSLSLRRLLVGLAQQFLLLFDLSATTGLSREYEGRRRLNFWPFLLLFCSNIGFLVNSLTVTISVAQRLCHGSAPHDGGYFLTTQETNFLIWAVMGGVGRLAALNLGQAPRDITRERIRRACLWFLFSAALVACTLFLATRMSAVLPAQIAQVARFAGWAGAGVLATVALVIGLSLTCWSRNLMGSVRKTFEDSAKSKGLAAATAWLATLDAGEYAQSWEMGYFLRTITREEWGNRLEKVRRPLGRVLARELTATNVSATRRRFVAKYVFATSFEGLPAARETVAFAVEPNLGWKAIGYLIRPADAPEEDPRGGEQGVCLSDERLLREELKRPEVKAKVATQQQGLAGKGLAAALLRSRQRGRALAIMAGSLLLLCGIYSGINRYLRIPSANEQKAQPAQTPTMEWKDVVLPATPTVPAALPNLSFGPVVELTADLSEPERDLFLSFETGKLMKEPGGRLNTPEPQKLHVADEALAWARSNRADILIRFCVKKTGPNNLINLPELNLKSLDMAMSPTTTNTEAWDGLSARAIATTVRSMPRHDWWQGIGWGGSDQTFLFRTREGNVGILLVTGYTDNPHSVKLCYKLMRQADTKSQTAEQPAPSSADLEQQIRTGLEYEPVVWSKGAIVRSVHLNAEGRKAIVVMDDSEAGRQDFVLSADNLGRFEGSLTGVNGGGLQFWYPISVLPSDNTRLEAEYHALPAGDAFEPDCELVILRPAGVMYSLLGIAFDTGKVVIVPNEIAGKPEDEIKLLHNNGEVDRWARDHGVDALARFTTNEFEMVGFDTPMNPLYLREGWQSLTPDRVKRAQLSGKLLDSGGVRDKSVAFFDNSGFAVAFRTRNNRLGAWRVAGKVGDPANPSGVKIRYKLVPNWDRIKIGESGEIFINKKPASMAELAAECQRLKQIGGGARIYYGDFTTHGITAAQHEALWILTAANIPLKVVLKESELD